MSPLESKMRDVIHRWEECAAEHIANHKHNHENYTGAETAARQAGAVRQICRALEVRIEQWKGEGLL